jgi:regulator of replication initiation timing
MSIPRYSINPLWWNIPLMDDHNGKLCEYRDYARLQDTLQCSLNSNRELKAENARLKTEVERLELEVFAFDRTIKQASCHYDNRLEDIRQLQAQVERLTKAGDGLHAFLINYIVENRISSAYLNKLDDGWNAAKEGKQS